MVLCAAGNQVSGKEKRRSRIMTRAYELLTRYARPVMIALFLLAIRLIWGWQFTLAGHGKLLDIQKPIHFFEKLGIPFPTANAWLVACVECFGGLLLMAGLGTRAVAIALTINMTVACLTADHEAVMKLISDGDVATFSQAAPFWFLVTSLLVLTFGPGGFSVDAVIKYLLRGRTTNAPPAHGFPVT